MSKLPSKSPEISSSNNLIFKIFLQAEIIRPDVELIDLRTLRGELLRIRSSLTWSKNLAFYCLNPSPFSGREGYKEFLDPPIVEKALIKGIAGNVSKESFKNSSVLLLRRRVTG